MEYLEFKKQYIETLEKFLTCKPHENYPDLIYGEKSKALADILVDMEEEHPEWVEKIDDLLLNDAKGA